jgi:hypothetical protein
MGATSMGESSFQLRRAVERLREGLFDPLAVRLLTAQQKQIDRMVDDRFAAVDAGEAPHLCICGSYGQGKSHSLTYIEDRALGGNFVTSLINLDPREVPFHDFRRVYRALLESMRFPGGETSLVRAWRSWAAERLDVEGRVSAEDLPAEMPHIFRTVLAGLAQRTLLLTPRQRQMKKHANYRPRAFPYWLGRGLEGQAVPINALRHALKYRQVDFYRDAPLGFEGDGSFVQMVRGLGRLFVQMGFRGWVLLFDEGESMGQTRVSCRSRSFQTLDRLLFPETDVRGLFPVFAFTGDFFQQVEEEDYGRLKPRDETPYFAVNYAEAWEKVQRYDLQDLSSQEWKGLGDKLIDLHARAYGWKPAEEEVRRALAGRLAATRGQETRYRLKGLVDELDLARQEELLGMRE